MVEYSPPPADLSKLNPIQRYLQKGALETRDWFRLFIIVMSYLLLRPYIEWLMKKWFDADPKKSSQDAQAEAKLTARIPANAIRGNKSEGKGGSTAKASGSEPAGEEEITLRRPGKGGAEFTATTLQEQLLNWDDLDLKARKPVEGDKNDVTEWLGGWDEKI